MDHLTDNFPFDDLTIDSCSIVIVRWRARSKRLVSTIVAQPR